jgi:NADPH:quinone reductase-like Zn-dependent oxidoreductase
MRAIAIKSFGGPDKLALTDLPRPRAAKGEVLVRIVAAGVNPVDWKIREGYLKDRLPHSFPLIPGWDVAGVVEELGEGTSRFRKGDKVWAYARKRVVQWGTYAEFTALAEDSVALMPSKTLFEEAAAMPLAALTAYQALHDRAQIREGAAVLVHAAAGGVGHLAVQLAVKAGARVYGTAGPDNASFVLGLGAAGVIDYTHEDFRDGLRRLRPEGVEVVLDAVGGETQTRSFDVLKPGGILVSIVDEPDVELARARSVRATWFFVEPRGEQLRILSSLVDRGGLRPHVGRIYPLAEAAQAQQESRGGHVRGKLVLAL